MDANENREIENENIEVKRIKRKYDRTNEKKYLSKKQIEDYKESLLKLVEMKMNEVQTDLRPINDKAQKKIDKEQLKIERCNKLEEKRIKKELQIKLKNEILQELSLESKLKESMKKTSMRGKSEKCKEHQKKNISKMRDGLRKSFLEKQKHRLTTVPVSGWDQSRQSDDNENNNIVNLDTRDVPSEEKHVPPIIPQLSETKSTVKEEMGHSVVSIPIGPSRVPPDVVREDSSSYKIINGKRYRLISHIQNKILSGFI